MWQKLTLNDFFRLWFCFFLNSLIATNFFFYSGTWHDCWIFFQRNVKWQVSSRMTSTKVNYNLFLNFFTTSALFLHERNSYSDDDGVGYLTYACIFNGTMHTISPHLRLYRLFSEVTFKFLYKYENYLGSYLDLCSDNIFK